MASGSFNVTTSNQYISGRVTWSSVADNANNRSTVTATLTLSRTNTGYTTWGTGTFYLKINGVEISNTDSFTITHNSNTIMVTGSVVVPHNADGEKSITISSWGSISGVFSMSTQSGTATLDSIPRESSITSSANWTAGNNLSISVSRSSSNFTHIARVYVNNILVYETPSNSKFGTSVTASLDQTKVFQQMDKQNSRTSRVEVDTYNGSTKINTSVVSVTGTCTAPSASTLQTNVGNFNIGATVTANVTRVNSGMTHTIRYYVNNVLIATRTNVGYSDDWTPTATQRNNMYNQTPNSNKVATRVEIDTFWHGYQVRTTQPRTGTAEVVNSRPLFNNGWEYADINPITVGVTGDNQIVIQGQSNVRATITSVHKAEAINGASMVGYYAILNGVRRPTSGNTPWHSTNTITFDFGTVSAGSNVTLTIRAIDSRGNWTEATKTITILPYLPPVVTTSVTRLNNFENQTTITLSGSISPLLVNGVRKNTLDTTATLNNSTQYRIKHVSSETWGDWTNFSGTNLNTNGTYVRNNVVLDLDNEQSFDVEIRTRDLLQTTTISRNVPVGIPIFFIDSVKKAVGVNTFPTEPFSFETTGKMIIEKLFLRDPSDTSRTLDWENENSIFFDRYGNIVAKDTTSNPNAYWNIRDKNNNHIARFYTGDNSIANGIDLRRNTNIDGTLATNSLTIKGGSNGASGITVNTANVASVDMGYASSNFVNLYLRPKVDGEARVTSTGTTDDYRPIRALEFRLPSSLRETKQDIEEFNERALDYIKNANVYMYRYKSSPETTHKQLGLMVDDTPRILHGQSGDTFELYALSSFLWKAVQELYEHVEYLEDKINKR